MTAVHQEPRFCHYKDFKDNKIKSVHTLVYSLETSDDQDNWKVKYAASVYKKENNSSWVRKDQNRLARDRLKDCPKSFIVKKYNKSPGYYQFRRLESFIMKKLYDTGVCSCENGCAVLQKILEEKQKQKLAHQEKARQRVEQQLQNREQFREMRRNKFKLVDNFNSSKKTQIDIFDPKLTPKEATAYTYFQADKHYKHYKQVLNSAFKRAMDRQRSTNPPVLMVLVWWAMTMGLVVYMKARFC